MASTEIETVSSGADKAKLGAAVLLAVAGFVGFYVLRERGALVQWGALIAALAVAVAVFAVSIHGRQLIGYGKDSWKEVKKVVWPTRRETTQMTAYVFAFVVVMALFLWLTDATLNWILYSLILGWR